MSVALSLQNNERDTTVKRAALASVRYLTHANANRMLFQFECSSCADVCVVCCCLVTFSFAFVFAFAAATIK